MIRVREKIIFFDIKDIKVKIYFKNYEKNKLSKLEFKKRSQKPFLFSKAFLKNT